MSEAPRYPFVAVDASPEESDDVAAALFDLGAMGVEERDATTLARGAEPGRVTVVGSFETREAADAAIAEMAATFPGGSARLEEVIGDAWRDAWKEHFAPFALTNSITVVPPWAPRPTLEPGVMALELEPGRAFGTGLHATTAIVAHILDVFATRKLPPDMHAPASYKGSEILDVGTGSGILSFVALLYGASRALAIDIDPDVVEVVRENAARNGLADRIEARAAVVETITSTFPWVLANIEAKVLLPLAPELVRVLAPGGVLILSGILEHEHDAIVEAYKSLPRGLTHLGTSRRGEAGGEGWVGIILWDKPAAPPAAGS
jgi:ribosomal protein L11 methyltransferase